jgi:uncharacterized membrane protein
MTWLQETSTEQVQENLGEQLKEHAQEISQTLGKSETVNEISSGILEPIYQIAEVMSIPSFYWVAFALMVAGVVSFAFQLVLGKFFLLFKGSLNLTEIFSDLLGLVISLTGLVLTTQAATQNSTFPENSVAVVSAAIAGAFFGLVFYWWGQKQEFRAVAGKRAEVKD